MLTFRPVDMVHEAVKPGGRWQLVPAHPRRALASTTAAYPLMYNPQPPA